MWFVKISLYLTLSSLIACSPMRLCSSEAFKKSMRKNSDLNDGCSYEPLNSLDIRDLNNFAHSNSLFKPIEMEMFIKKAFEVLEKFRTGIIRNGTDGYVFDEDSLTSKIINAFMPIPSRMDSSGFKFVFLLKFISFLHHSYYKAWEPEKLIGLKQFIDEILNKHISVKQYSKILTLNDHYQLLSHFHEIYADDYRFKFSDYFGWISYAYMIVLEQSEHLDKQFNYGMMMHMNKVRNAANSYYLLQSNENSDSELDYYEKFKLNFDVYKGDVSTEKVKNQFRLTLARGEVRKLNKYYSTYVENPIIEIYFANAYCAIKSLSGPKFIELVDASNLNIALFELSASLGVVGKLHKSLLKECQGAKAIENDLQTQLNAIDFLVGDQGSHEDYKFLLNGPVNTLSPYLNKLENHILAMANEWLSAPNLTEYIKLLEICVKIDQHNVNWNIKRTIDRFHFVYYSFVNRSHAFDNLDQLIEIDRLTNQLSEDGNYKFLLEEPERLRQLLRFSFENFGSLMTPAGNDSKEIRTKQRIVLKTLLFGAYGSLHIWQDEIEEMGGYFARIVEFFNALANLDAQNIVEDKYLLHFWDKLYYYVQFWIREHASGTARLFECVFRLAEQPYNSSGNSANDFLMYINHLNVARYMDAFNKTLSNQTLDNILLLEESVGDAIILEDFVRNHVTEQKNSFHEYFGDMIRRRQEETDLKRFVHSMIEQIFEPSDKFIFERFEVLNSIFVAVQNTGENAKALIGSKLIATLGDISYDPFYSSKKYRDQFMKNVYDGANRILNFKESFTVSWKY